MHPFTHAWEKRLTYSLQVCNLMICIVKNRSAKFFIFQATKMKKSEKCWSFENVYCSLFSDP
jgi:hypothetical protein